MQSSRLFLLAANTHHGNYYESRPKVARGLEQQPPKTNQLKKNQSVEFKK